MQLRRDQQEIRRITMTVNKRSIENRKITITPNKRSRGDEEDNNYS
jgi:hypothetical protein